MIRSNPSLEGGANTFGNIVYVKVLPSEVESSDAALHLRDVLSVFRGHNGVTFTYKPRARVLNGSVNPLYELLI